MGKEALPSDRVSAIKTPEDAWGGATGRGVRVAVVDSGVDASHEALAGSVKGGIDIDVSTSGMPVTMPCSFADTVGHGTACAGIIKDLAPEVELYSVKVVHIGQTGSGGAFLTGLKWAIDNDMQVVNLSLGTTDKQCFAPLHELVDQAYSKGIILVAAANNVPVPSYPSIYSSLVSVGNLPIRDKFHFTYTPGQRIEFGARGTGVRAPWLGNTYKHVTGTSFATPHISGFVSLILSKHPGLRPFEVKTILYALAREK